MKKSSYLRTGEMTIERSGETVELIELNALGQKELTEAHAAGDYITAAAVTLKHGTKKWHGKTPDEIMEELPMSVIQEVSEAIVELSGLLEDSEKN